MLAPRVYAKQLAVIQAPHHHPCHQYHLSLHHPEFDTCTGKTRYVKTDSLTEGTGSSVPELSHLYTIGQRLGQLYETIPVGNVSLGTIKRRIQAANKAGSNWTNLYIHKRQYFTRHSISHTKVRIC